MKFNFNAFLRHFFVITFLGLAALAYFYPVLQGKVIYQSDIVQYKGMAEEQEQFRDQYGEEPYWTNSAFGGMPTYQLGARYPHDYIKKLDRVIRFLPRPADYLFLYFLGFYILMCCLKVEYRLAILGALAFGFSTYLIIILNVGHNAKAHAIGYLPMVLGGIILTFRKKYFWGFILTSLAMALEIQANHFQMTYYFFLLVMVLGAVYMIYAIREKQLKHYFISLGILIPAVALALLTNATSLLATKEYADWSTRGTSALTINPDGSPKTRRDGLDRDYITQYSYGITESLNLLVPRLFGGGSVEKLGEGSRTYDFLTDQGVPRTQALEFTNEMRLYWGDQPIVAAPAYIGAVILFLFLLGILLVRGRAKWWLLFGSLLALLLSWGKNFGVLTDFMIDYFPFYNKFRAVSSIQVILELCAPVLAVLALKAFLNSKVDLRSKKVALSISFLSMMGIGLGLLLLKSAFDFTGGSDEIMTRYYGEELVSLIRRDREAVYVNDTLRSMTLIALTAGILWVSLRKNLKREWVITAAAVLVVVDLVGVNLRYWDKDNFVSSRRMERPIARTKVNQLILQDTAYYRVLNLNEGLNGATTSFFHKSLGGYHAAKPARLQDLFEFHVYKNNRRVLNMLNAKYIIQPDEEGAASVSLNPEALGSSWFIRTLVPVSSADQAIIALDTLQVSETALINTSDFPEASRKTFARDSTAQIRLASYQPNALRYHSKNGSDGFAVFSEMYYPEGWNAYIDGKRTAHLRVNYTLRGLEIPAGEHEILFKFEPEVVRFGSKISLAGNVALLLIILGGILYSTIRRRKPEA
ncbi:YfhO family protein [Robiginitalea sp. IMCC43444]|uniref:YfhO family protein n=1 Tax=Robiginitalea sp. IMCC43444 TaxID=3459121 RepID=UPI0040438DBB